MNTPEINVGIDTSQSSLDIAIRPIDEFFSVDNSPEGIKEAIQRLKRIKPKRILIEATGRLEMPFAIAAYKAKLPIVVCNATQVHNFAKATGKLAKTDKLDAFTIAHYGEVASDDVRMVTRLTSQLAHEHRLKTDITT